MKRRISDHPTSLDTVGQIDTTTIECTCGETHTLRSKRIPSTANPALATSIVLDMEEFHSQRIWLGIHRPHGKVWQR